MGFLGGLIRAGVAAGGGALKGANAAEQTNYERERQQKQDALQAMLLNTQIENIANDNQRADAQLEQNARQNALAEVAARRRAMLDAQAVARENQPPPLYNPQSDPDVLREAELRRRGLGRYHQAPDGTPAGPKPPTEGERRAGGLLIGAQSALDEIHGLLQGDPTKGRAPYSPANEGWMSKTAQAVGMDRTARGLSSENGKLFRNAVKRLTTNYLYVVSGAQASPAEIEKQSEQMTNDILDTPTTLDQKIRFMEGKVEEIRKVADRAATPRAANGGGGSLPDDELIDKLIREHPNWSDAQIRAALGNP